MGKRKKRRVPIKTGRVVHHFWLNIRNAPEDKLDIEVQELKKQRKFAETVRDGLRLILDLRAGSLVVLFELFPHLRERLDSQPIAQTPPAPDTTELAKEIATQIILQGGGEKILLQSQQPPMNGLKTDTGQDKPKTLGKGVQPQFTLPVYDEDELETHEAFTVKSNGTSSNNLMRQLMGMVQDDSKASHVHMVRTG